jgi:dihydrofolate synthase/folylpolyglutamate synthase
MPPTVTPTPADYAATKDYLFALKSRGPKLGLERMQVLAAALEHPEQRYPCIHVAGTNGKGSVAAMLDAIFHAAGWRTGLYTSPHLVRLGERVQVDRRILTEEEIVAYTRELQGYADRLAATDPTDHPSFFEFMTGAAFLHFARRAVNIGIIEVGLGGRFDATNVVRPEVAVITSIGLDHCEYLGDTIEKIAFEKAGIVKPGRPVVIGRMPVEAAQTIERIAAGRGSPVHSVAREFGEDLDLYPQTNLECTYQRWNAATATLVARLMPARWRLTPEAVTRGLQHVNWPGRWQRVHVGATPVILDASHNPEGALMLDESLRRLAVETGRAPGVVTGALGEHRARALLATVARHAREIHLVIPHQDRASNFEVLEACVPAGFGGVLRRSTIEGVFPTPDRCAIGDANDTVVVTGSIYLLGEVFARLQPDRLGIFGLQDW